MPKPTNAAAAHTDDVSRAIAPPLRALGLGRVERITDAAVAEVAARAQKHPCSRSRPPKGGRRFAASCRRQSSSSILTRRLEPRGAHAPVTKGRTPWSLATRPAPAAAKFCAAPGIAGNFSRPPAEARSGCQSPASPAPRTRRNSPMNPFPILCACRPMSTSAKFLASRSIPGPYLRPASGQYDRPRLWRGGRATAGVRRRRQLSARDRPQPLRLVLRPHGEGRS